MRRPEYLEATGAPPLLPATERGELSAYVAVAGRARRGARQIRAALPELVSLRLRRRSPRYLLVCVSRRAPLVSRASEPDDSGEAVMKCIIVAAGMGRRLSPYTDDRPKTLVEINGRSILERQVDAYRAAGVDEINIVRGYMKEKIDVPGARTFDNDEFRTNNILSSLFYAEAAMDGGFLFSYSDIVFRPEVVRTVHRHRGRLRAGHRPSLARGLRRARESSGRGGRGGARRRRARDARRQEDDAARARRPASSSASRASPRARPARCASAFTRGARELAGKPYGRAPQASRSPT